MHDIIDPPHSRSTGTLPVHPIHVHLCRICGSLFSPHFVMDHSSFTRCLFTLLSHFVPSCLGASSHSSAKTGSFGGRFRVVLGSFGGPFGVVLGSFWGRFGVGLGSVYYHVIVMTETLTPGPASTYPVSRHKKREIRPPPCRAAQHRAPDPLDLQNAVVSQ